MSQKRRKDTLKEEYLRTVHSCDDEDCDALEGAEICSGSITSSNDRLIWVMFERRICTKFLTDTLNVSKVLLDSCKGTPNALASQSSERSPRFSAGFSKADSVKLILDSLVEFSEQMPHREEFHLPMIRKYQVFEFYKKECGSRGFDTASLPYFLQVWSSERSNMKCRRHHGFSKCDTCEELESKLETLSLRRSDLRKDICNQLKSHWAFVRAERLIYYTAREKSRDNPLHHLSIIIDGADQSAYQLPHWAVSTKSTSKAGKLQVKLLAALVHHQNNRFYCALMSEEQPGGANCVIEMLHRVLTIEKHERGGKLPRKLHLQLDNATGQNKNRYVMGYCELLVMMGVFEEIEVFFLPVGHTHEDIDQAFSRIAVRLHVEDALTLRELVATVSHSYTPTPRVFRMMNQANISGLFEASGSLQREPIRAFSTYRLFRFLRGGPAQEDAFLGLKLLPTICSVKYAGSDHEVTEFKPKGASMGIFLKNVPDLRCIPMTKLKNPGQERYDEQRKCLQSCEERIADASKVAELQDLFDMVHQDRNVGCPWDFNNCIELNGDFTPRDENNVPSSDAEDAHLEDSDAELHSIGYDVGDFVATLANTTTTNESTFWLGRVTETEKDHKGNLSRLKVVWMDAVVGRNGRNEDPLKAKYRGATKRIGRHLAPFTGNISVRTVLCRFAALLDSSYIPVSVQKQISSALHRSSSGY